MEKEIIFYQPNDVTSVEIIIENDTIWLTQQKIATLFDTTKQNVSLHLGNIFREGELIRNATVKESFTVQNEGGRNVKRRVELYNLDVIIAVGYRIKTMRATQIRIWATEIIKHHLLNKNVVNQRFEKIEEDIFLLKQKNKEFDVFIKTSLPPSEGIFFDGQIFDAYVFVSELIKKAKIEIILIDNYIDETVLNVISKRNENVKATIYTSRITRQFQLDLERYNSQYQPITIHTFSKSHDLFLIIDDEVYHIGASLKDLGKKWFAFSILNFPKEEIIGKLGCFQ